MYFRFLLFKNESILCGSAGNMGVVKAEVYGAGIKSIAVCCIRKYKVWEGAEEIETNFNVLPRHN